jgi:hypothetical protein
MTYPIKHCADQLVAEKGTLTQNQTADGTSWTVTLTGTKTSYDVYAVSIVKRGVEVHTLAPQFGIPAGFYIDEIRFRNLLTGTTDGASAVSVDIVCREAGNMGDGIVSGSIPDVYEVTWERGEKPLAALKARYRSFSTRIDSGATDPYYYRTVYDMAVAWTLGDAAERANVFAKMASLADSRFDEFQDYIVFFMLGVESYEVFYPVLTRTQVTNSAPTATGTPGQIDTSIPSGFSTLKPSGTWTYRQMPDRITRTGRTGAYNIVSQWVGDPAWSPRLYGTATEIGGEYQTIT